MEPWVRLLLCVGACGLSFSSGLVAGDGKNWVTGCIATVLALLAVVMLGVAVLP